MSSSKYVEVENKEVLEIANDAYTALKNNVNIDAGSDLNVSTVALVTLKHLINYVKETGKEVNFCQLFDLAVEDGEIVAGPGQEFKLLIKSDDASEEE